MNRNRFAVLFAAVALLSTSAAHAVTDTWTGAGLNNLWTTATNWSDTNLGFQPGDDVIFGSGFASGASINLVDVQTVNSFTVDTGTQLFWTAGALTLNSGAFNRTVTSSGIQTFDNQYGSSNTNITLGANAVWNIGGAGVMAIGYGYTDGAVSGASQVVLTEVNAGTTFTKTGSGKLILNATSAMLYTGNTYVLGGTLDFAGTNTFANSPAIFIGDTSGAYNARLASTNGGPYYPGGNNLTNDRNITVQAGSVGLAVIGADLAAGLATAPLTTYSGNITLNKDLRVIAAGYTASTNTYFGVPNSSVSLTGQITGAGSGLVFTGLGTNFVSGTVANTYTGTTKTYASALFLQMTGVQALGGDVIVGNGGAYVSDSSGYSSFGLPYAQLVGSKLFLSASNLPATSSVTVNANAYVMFGNTSNYAAFGGNPFNQTLVNVSLKGGGLAQGGASMVLIGSNYTGAGASFLPSDFANGNLNITGDLNISGGSVIYYATGAGVNLSRIGLSGKVISDASVVGFTTNRLIQTAGYPFVENAGVAFELVGAGLHEFNIGANAFTEMILPASALPRVYGAGGIEKTGAGTLILSGTNGQFLFTGGLKVSGGVLIMSPTAANRYLGGSGALELAGGDLRNNAGSTIGVGAPVTVSANSTLSGTNGGAAWLFTNTFTVNSGVTLTLNPYGLGATSAGITVNGMTLGGPGVVFNVITTNQTSIANFGIGARGAQGGTFTVNGNISSVDGFTKDGTGLMQIVTNSGGTLTGTITNKGGGYIVFGSSGTADDTALGVLTNQVVADNGGFKWTGGGGSFNHPLQVLAGGATLWNDAGGVTSLDTAGQLTGSGPLTLVGEIFINQAQTGFTGAVTQYGALSKAVVNGSLSGATSLTLNGGNALFEAVTTNSLGAANVTVNGGIYQPDTSGTTTGTITVKNAGMLDLGNSAPHWAGAGAVTIGAGSTINGSVAVLSTFTRGVDTTLDPGAIVSISDQSTVNTSPIGSLGTAADLFWGVGYHGGNADYSLTIGAGTPWAGIAAGRLYNGSGLASAQMGPTIANPTPTITLNSDATLEGFTATPAGEIPNKALSAGTFAATIYIPATINDNPTIGDLNIPGGTYYGKSVTLILNGVNIASSGGPYNVKLAGPVLLNSTSASYDGVLQFQAQPNSIIILGTNNADLGGVGVMGNGGSGARPMIADHARVAVFSSNAINGNLTLNNGSILQITTNMTSGLTGAGVITSNGSAGAQLDTTNALIGAQFSALNNLVGTTGVIRLAGSGPLGVQVYDNLTNSTNSQGNVTRLVEFAGLDQIVGPGAAATFVIMNTNRVWNSFTNTTLNGGVITNDSASRSILQGITYTGGVVDNATYLADVATVSPYTFIIGPNGADFAATTGTTLTLTTAAASIRIGDPSTGNLTTRTVTNVNTAAMISSVSGTIYINSSNLIDGYQKWGTVTYSTSNFLPTTGVTFDVQAGRLTLSTASGGVPNNLNLILRNNSTASQGDMYRPAPGYGITVNTGDTAVFMVNAGNSDAKLYYDNQLQGGGTFILDCGYPGIQIGTASGTNGSNPNFSGRFVVRQFGDPSYLKIYGNPSGSPLGTGTLVFQGWGPLQDAANNLQRPAVSLYLTTNDPFLNPIEVNTNALIGISERTGATDTVLPMGSITINGNNNLAINAGTSKPSFGQININGNVSFSVPNTRITLGALNDGTVARTVDVYGNSSIDLKTTAVSFGAGSTWNQNDGVLYIGAASALGSGSLVVNGNAVAFAGTNAANFLNGLKATVNNEQAVLRIESAQSGMGSITANAGLVSLDNVAVTAGNVKVAAGAQIDANGSASLTVTGNLSGNGLITGTTIVTGTGSLTPGSSAGTLYTEHLTLNDLTSLVWELASVNTVGGGVNDLVSANGNLVLDGKLTVVDLNPTLFVGSYRLFNYTGTLTDNTLDIVSLNSNYVGAIDLSTSNQVNLVISLPSSTTNMVWNGTNGPNWDATTTNWNTPPVLFANNTDTVLDDSGVNTAINLSVAVTPLSLTISNNVQPYMINGSGSINGATSLVKNGSASLTIDNSNGFTGGSTFNGGVTTVNHTNGLGTGTVVTANGGTELHFGSTVNIGALTVGAGTLVVADANGQHVIVTDGLTIAGGSTNTPTGTVQLHDNSMIVHNGNLLAVRAQIKAARNGGAWNQPGITTDLSSTNVSPTGKVKTLGYALGSDTNMVISSVHGQAITGTDVVVKYTYAGDANLDGSVDGLDIAKWAVNFTGALGLGATADPAKVWTQGDWNFDGSVDGLDAAIWATNFTGALGGSGLSGTVVDAPGANPTAVAMLEGMGLTVVPEPASLVLLGLGGALILGGGRRGRNARRAA